ncbi:unnamed protein product [Acanthoscelides obtectus]|uniref:Uncharacterized protein n=1 Tax=Acanthoscelides obtectus TaxID=200917 RepID=A0A9P0L6G4_ACAOB|nr:unnamed protein product [Acanthoscelides obtectus]CAK1653800.1 hypothetical protein AOBTE_LOCUS18370 [Acanthoscelides obtectus]
MMLNRRQSRFMDTLRSDHKRGDNTPQCGHPLAALNLSVSPSKDIDMILHVNMLLIHHKSEDLHPWRRLIHRRILNSYRKMHSKIRFTQYHSGLHFSHSPKCTSALDTNNKSVYSVKTRLNCESCLQLYPKLLKDCEKTAYKVLQQNESLLASRVLTSRRIKAMTYYLEGVMALLIESESETCKYVVGPTVSSGPVKLAPMVAQLKYSKNVMSILELITFLQLHLIQQKLLPWFNSYRFNLFVVGARIKRKDQVMQTLNSADYLTQN